MKILRLSVFALLFLLLSVAASWAHPPKEVLLSWDGKDTLKAEIVHNVDDPQKHYINRATVYVNGKLVQQKDYTQQSSNTGGALSFSLSGVTSGSTVKVEVNCVIFGSTAGTLVIP